MKPIKRGSCRIPAVLLAIGLIGLYIGAATTMAMAQYSGYRYIQVGYAIITPTTPDHDGLLVMEAFGQNASDGNAQPQAAALGMTTSAMMMVNTSAERIGDLAICVTNPGSEIVSLTITLRRNDGSILGTKNTWVWPYMQRVRYLEELFAPVQLLPQDLPAMLQIQSNMPVSITGLKSENWSFVPVAVTQLTDSVEVPVREPGVGGPGAVVLPYFALGGGWDTGLFIVNSGSSPLSVRVDLYRQNGSAMVAQWISRVNTSSGSSLLIPAGGAISLVPWN